MKFLLTNSDLDIQISGIKLLIRQSMNGVVSDSMKSHGLIYKQNYGVSIPRIREIASKYTKNHDLAQRLWLLNIRETMILATMLQPFESFNEQLASEWLAKCNNIELVEQANLNLYQHLYFAPEFCLQRIHSEVVFQQYFGFTLALRIYQRLSPDQIHEIAEKGIQLANHDEPLLYTSIAACLARCCRKDKLTAESIYQKTKQLNNQQLRSNIYILQAVKQELIFLGYLNENF
ncbi:MAG: DNA alkylation repair protein [Paludibacter sp.]|nr:DNA alkylation repair protein [Paludibacter sp.]